MPTSTNDMPFHVPPLHHQGPHRLPFLGPVRLLRNIGTTLVVCRRQEPARVSIRLWGMRC